MHALVIGGTGMLADLSIWLASEYEHVTVIGREWGKFESLIEKAGNLAERIVPISVDYNDDGRFVDAIRRDLWRHGPVNLCVAWVRSKSMGSLEIAAKEISEHSREEWRLFRILGVRGLKEKKMPELPSSARYREVTLGFIREDSRSRWLTNDEICQGIRDAIETDRQNTIIGLSGPDELFPG